MSWHDHKYMCTHDRIRLDEVVVSSQDRTTLTAITPEVISRQATINIGERAFGCVSVHVCSVYMCAFTCELCVHLYLLFVCTYVRLQQVHTHTHTHNPHAVSSDNPVLITHVLKWWCNMYIPVSISSIVHTYTHQCLHRCTCNAILILMCHTRDMAYIGREVFTLLSIVEMYTEI